MELTFPTIEVEKSGEFKTKSFGFADSGVIAHILRKKIYSNPIYVICQEIMSNARDANREAGRGDEPIKVQAPSSLDLHLSIKDHGIGISPDRMDNIFLNYGASTKRSNNSQTGGFGIGAKTPFSYADAFQVITVTEENGKRIKRSYSAYLDTSQMGEMSLLSQVETQEPTGTEIKMLVQRQDINAFCAAIAKITEFWTPRPKVGANVTYSTTKITVDKGDWFIYGDMQTRNNNYYGSYSHKESAFCLIDSIRYPLDIQNILAWISQHRKGLEERASAFLSTNIVLRFKTGQVAVAASREALDYIDSTYNAIADAVDKATKELVKECEDSVAAAKTLEEAVDSFNKFKFRGLVNSATWRKIELEDNYTLNFKAFNYHQTRSGALTPYEYNFIQWSPLKNTPTISYYIDEVFHEDVKTTTPNPTYNPSALYGKDAIKEIIKFAPPNKKKAKTLSDTHGTSSRYNGSNFFIIRFLNKAEQDTALADPTNIINHIGFKWLKDVAETKIVYKKGANVKLGSFRTLSKAGYNWKWEEDKNITISTGGVYAVLKPGGTLIKCGSKELVRSDSVRVENLLGCKIVAVGQRLADKLAKESSWTSLEKEIQTKFDNAYTKLSKISGYFINSSLENILGCVYTQLKPFISSLHDKSPLKKLLNGVVLANDANYSEACNLWDTNLVTGTDPKILSENSENPEDILLKYYPLFYVALKTYSASILMQKPTLEDIQNYITEKEKLYV